MPCLWRLHLAALSPSNLCQNEPPLKNCVADTADEVVLHVERAHLGALAEQIRYGSSFAMRSPIFFQRMSMVERP